MTTATAGHVTTAYRRRMLAVLSLGWAALQTGRFALPPLIPRIEASLGLSSTVVGLALTAFGLVYAVTQYPSGTYSDTLGRASLLVPGFAVLVAAFALVALAVTPALFVLATLLLGVGKGLYASPARALLADLYTDTRGRALGVFSAATDLGGLAAAGLAVLVLGTTWRLAFVPVVVGVALVGTLFVVWNGEPYALGRPPLDTRRTVRRVVATRAQRERLLAFALFYFAAGGVINFYPSLLVEAGVTEARASGVFALLFVVGILIKPTVGAASDRLPRLLVAVTGLVVAAAGLAVVLLGRSLPLLTAGTLLVAIGYKAQLPIADAAVMSAAPDDSVGGDLGAARAVFLGATAAGPGVVGVVADAASFVAAFWLLTATFLLAAAVLVAGRRRH